MRRKQPLQQTVTVPWGRRRTQSLKRWRIWITDAAVGHRGYYRTTMTTGLGTETLHLPLLVLYHTFSKQYITHETKIFRIHTIRLRFSSYYTIGLQAHLLSKCRVDKKTACPYTSVKTQHAEVLFCWGSVQLFLSAVKLCAGRLQQIAVSEAIRGSEKRSKRTFQVLYKWNRYFFFK